MSKPRTPFARWAKRLRRKARAAKEQVAETTEARAARERAAEARTQLAVSAPATTSTPRCSYCNGRDQGFVRLGVEWFSCPCPYCRPDDHAAWCAAHGVAS